MADPTLRVKQTLDNSQFKKGLKDSQSYANKMSESLKGIGAAIAGAFAVKAIADFSKEAVMLAGKAEGIEQAFNRIADKGTLEKLKEATRGTVSELELMKNAVKANNFKIPIEQLATFFEFATKRAAQTGESVDYLVESIILGIGRKSPLILDNLGISAIELREKLKGVGMESASVGDVTKAMGEIIEDEMKRMGDVSVTTAQRIEQMSTGVEELKTAWGKLIVSGEKGGIVGWLTKELEYLTWGLNKIREESGGFKKWWNWFWQTGEFSSESFEMDKTAKKNAEQLQKNANILQGVSGGFKTYGEMVDASAAANKAATPVIEKTAEELAKEKKAAEDAAKAYQKYLEETRKAAQGTDVGRMTRQTAGAEMNTGRFLRTGEMQFDLALPTDQLDEFELKLKELPGSYTEFVDSMSEESERLADAFNEMGAAVGSALGEFIKGEATFGEVAENLLQSIIKIVAGYLTESVAASFAGGASAGGPAAPFTGAAAAAAALSMFGALVPALMAEGGVVPGGYPGDTYPAMLSSGEVVVPPGKLDSVIGKGGQTVRVVGQIRGQDIHFVNEKQTSKLNRYR